MTLFKEGVKLDFAEELQYKFPHQKQGEKRRKKEKQHVKFSL